MAELLIVEDDPHTRLGLRLFLEDSGWTVHEAGSFEAAMTLVEQVHFDAIVTDIVIPREQSRQRRVPGESVGLELVAELKSRWPDLGIVIFSAHQDRGEIVSIYGKLGLFPEEQGIKLRRDVLLSKLWLVASLEGWLLT